MEENFETLLEEAFQSNLFSKRQIVPGVIMDVQDKYVVVDIGMKSEGVIPILEFQLDKEKNNLPKVGDVVRVYIDKLEDINGQIVLSREKAIQEEAWVEIKELFSKDAMVEGYIQERIRGGFLVNIMGIMAFLPSTHVDVRPVKNTNQYIGLQDKFQILKLDTVHNNMVVSRRNALEQAQNKIWSDKINQLKVGDTVEAVVKNIMDYGAFVGFDNVDGLLHITDMSWNRVSHSSDIIHMGEKLTLKILSIDPEQKRISLGLKQMKPNPWEGAEEKYKPGTRLTGKAINTTDYGVFVELDEGFEGLVHISEMTWSRKYNQKASDIIKAGDRIDVEVLDIDEKRHRIALSMRQTQPNPWEQFEKEHPEGSNVTVTVESIKDFGIAVNYSDELGGIIRLADLDWVHPGEDVVQQYKPDDKIEVQVLNINVEKGQIYFGVKQLIENPVEKALKKYKVGDIVTALIQNVDNRGLRVSVGDLIIGTIKRTELGLDRRDQRVERFVAGEKVDAMITRVNSDGWLILSIKQYENKIEKEVVKKYGSSDSGASLGDILGVALKKSDTSFASSLRESSTATEDKEE